MHPLPSWKWTIFPAMALAAGVLVGAEALPSVSWSVEPDSRVNATAAAIAATTSGPASMRAWAAADPAYIKPNLEFQFPIKGSRELFVPNRPSRMVLARAPYAAGWELWDLGLGKKTSEGKGKINLNDPILSPSGEFVAGRAFGGTDGMRAEVWSLKNGSRAAIIKAPRGSFPADLVGFVGDDKVCYFEGGSLRRSIHIMKISTGEVVASFQAPERLSEPAFLTPTGKYLILKADEALALYSTDNGQHVGTIPLDPESKPGDPLNARQVAGIAFTAGGLEMAILRTGTNAARITLIDMKTGKKRYDHTFEDRQRRQQIKHAAPIEYLPDNSGWLLFGQSIVDRSSMAIVHTLPEKPDLLLARAIGPNQVLQITVSNDRMTAETVSFSKKDIARAADIVKAGGKAEDAKLPPTTAPVLAGIAQSTLEGALAQPWLVSPASQPDAKRTLAHSIPIRPAQQSPKPGEPPASDDITAIAFTSRETNAAIVEHANRNPGDSGKPFGRSKTWIERYDLSTGTPSATTELPGLLQLLDASPTGNTIVFRSGTDRDRVDLLAFEKSTYKPLTSFRPYNHVQPRSEMPSYRSDKPHATVAAAALIDDTHLLTTNESGLLICWELPTAKALWQTTLAGATRQVALSPDRKLAAVAIKGGLCVFEPLTGKALNGLPADTSELAVSALAFSHDGQQLIARAHASGGSTVQIYDLKSGNTLAEVVVPNDRIHSSGISLQVPAPGYLLVDHALLVSLEHKCVIWSYETSAQPGSSTAAPPRMGSTNPYARTYFTLPRAGRLPNMLINVQLPHAEAVKTVTKVNASDLFEWAPGMKVSLNISVVGDDNFRKLEVERWKNGLKDLGFEVVDGAPNVLNASSFIMTGTPVQYTITGTRDETFSITPRVPGHTIQLSVNGKQVWRTANDQPPNYGASMVFLTVKKDETVQQAADRMHPAPTTASTIIMPPKYIFKNRAIPKSQITPRGIEPSQ